MKKKKKKKIDVCHLIKEILDPGHAYNKTTKLHMLNYGHKQSWDNHLTLQRIMVYAGPHEITHRESSAS